MEGLDRLDGQNDMLDLLKCIAIYSVVFIHILLPGPVGVALNCLARFGVPLFFLSAGYFSWGRQSQVLRRRAARTARLLLFACAVLLALGCVLALRNGESAAAYVLGRFTPGNLRELLLHQVVPLPYAWPLWFLAALLMIYLIWWGLTALTRGKLPYNALGLLALGLLAVHLALGEGRSLSGLPVDSLSIRNVWLDGLPFFALGAWMGEHRRRIEGLPAAPLWAGAALSCLLALAERSRTEFLDLYLGSVLAALLLMAAAVNSPRVKSRVLRGTVCCCGRELTFYIFAFHVPIYGILKEWQGAAPLFAWAMARPWLLPFLVAALATLLALVLNWGASRLRPRPVKGGFYENH